MFPFCALQGRFYIHEVPFSRGGNAEDDYSAEYQRPVNVSSEEYQNLYSRT